MLCDLGEEECTKFRKQKMEKEKKLNAAKSVRRDEKVSYDQWWASYFLKVTSYKLQLLGKRSN